MSWNLNGDDQDIYYRYKAPFPIINYNRWGTEIVNIGELAKSFGREEKEILKFIQLYFNLKTKILEDKTMFSKKLDKDEIMLALKLYINEFVICGVNKCTNPETVYRISGSKKNKIIKTKCKACGKKRILDSQNQLIIKLCRYIVSN